MLFIYKFEVYRICHIMDYIRIYYEEFPYKIINECK